MGKAMIAHIREDQIEQSVEAHLAKSAELAAQYAGGLGMPNAAYLAALLHDIGKLSDAFQSYLRYCAAHPNDHSLRGSVTHAIQGARYIWAFAKSREGANAMHICLAGMLALVISGHHGGLNDCVSPDGEQPLSDRLTRDEPNLHYREALDAFAQLSLSGQVGPVFQKAADELGAIIAKMKRDGTASRFNEHLIVKYLFSCLIDADRTDTNQFMAGGAPDSPAAPWEAWQARLMAHLGAKAREYGDSPIARLRASVSDQCFGFAGRQTGVYRLTVPTGGGKTLASLRFALEHAHIHQKSRIFYFAPYLSILDQNARLIREILGEDGLILEHHSALAEERKQYDYDLFSQRWDRPVVLSSMVQFLDTFYKGGTRAVRRLHSLANSVLILDEIQSVPPRLIHLFNGAVNFLSKMLGSTVVLCSATQPPFESVGRKMLIPADAEMVPDTKSLFEALKRTRVVPAIVEGGYAYDALADFALRRMAERGLSASLIVVNTKKDALSLFRSFCESQKTVPEEERFAVLHLSTSMCQAHRVDALNRIRKGLSDESRERLVCVSTQLIEAGVDISFPCVFRALAGLDSIAQAFGRCNRHSEAASRDVFIVNLRDENLPNQLDDLRKGQETTRRVLGELERNGVSPDEILSPQVMERYFQYFYHLTKDQMDAPVRKDGTLFDWLGANKQGYAALKSLHDCSPSTPQVQAFKTAGDNFEAIQSDTSAILVPYEGGEALIDKLSKPLSLPDQKRLLDKARPYSVNVFSYRLAALESAGALIVLPSGHFALQKRFYDAKVGLVAKSPMDFLCDDF